MPPDGFDFSTPDDTFDKNLHHPLRLRAIIYPNDCGGEATSHEVRVAVFPGEPRDRYEHHAKRDGFIQHVQALEEAGYYIKFGGVSSTAAAGCSSF